MKKHILPLILLMLFALGSGILFAQTLFGQTPEASNTFAPEDFVDLTGNGLNPMTATVSVGTTVTWRNQTNESYFLQSGHPYSNYLPTISREANRQRIQTSNQIAHLSDSFSGEIPPNGHLNHRFDEIGRFPYFAISNNTVVTGTIIVEGDATSTPTPLSSTATASPTNTATPEPTASATPSPTATATPVPFTLTSSAFAEGGTIATQYTFNAPPQCSGQNISVPLSWEGTPTGTVSFALIMDDPDAANFLHWVQFNIPAATSSLPEAVGGPNIGNQGRNDFGQNGYGGPCPPSGTHRYVFTLYALDTTLELADGASRTAVVNAMNGHILEQTDLTGVRSR